MSLGSIAMTKPRLCVCALKVTSAVRCFGSSRLVAKPVAVAWKAPGSVMSRSWKFMRCRLPFSCPLTLSGTSGQRLRKSLGMSARNTMRSFLPTCAFIFSFILPGSIGSVSDSGRSISTSMSLSGVFNRNLGSLMLPFSIMIGPERSVTCSPLFSFSATCRSFMRSVGSW